MISFVFDKIFLVVYRYLQTILTNVYSMCQVVWQQKIVGRVFQVVWQDDMNTKNKRLGFNLQMPCETVQLIFVLTFLYFNIWIIVKFYWMECVWVWLN